MTKLFLILILLLTWKTGDIQEKALDPIIVEANGSTCEVNAATFDNLAAFLRSSNERLFVVARLGDGERSRDLNRRRLHNIRTFFKDGWPQLEANRFVFADGDRIKGQGRVEFYLGSTLLQISFVHRGKDICVDCCDYPDYRYYGAGKTDRPTKRH